MSGMFREGKLPVKAILIGVGSAAVVILLLLCVICGIMTATSAVESAALPYILLIADAAGAFIGAYLGAVINKSSGLIIGLVCGFLLFIILLVIGLGTGETIGILTPLRLIVLLLFGALGGIKGVNKKEKLHIK